MWSHQPVHEQIKMRQTIHILLSFSGHVVSTWWGQRSPTPVQQAG